MELCTMTQPSPAISHPAKILRDWIWRSFPPRNLDLRKRGPPLPPYLSPKVFQAGRISPNQSTPGLPEVDQGTGVGGAGCGAQEVFAERLCQLPGLSLRLGLGRERVGDRRFSDLRAAEGDQLRSLYLALFPRAEALYCQHSRCHLVL